MLNKELKGQSVLEEEPELQSVLEEDPELQSVVDGLIGNRKNLKVLEVGCGSSSHVDFGPDAYIVGIDNSGKQLERNLILKEKILADAETHQLPESEFDVVICWWVLEHLSRPDKVLMNCQKSLKKDGIMILAIPNVRALKVLMTKYTPHEFHVWVYKHIFGVEEAGIDDNVPFKTYLRGYLAPESIKRFARENGLAIERFHMYENPRQAELRSRHWLIDASWKVLAIATKVLSFGQLDAELTDFIAVLRKT